MKKLILFAMAMTILFSCKTTCVEPENVEYRTEMRNFVIQLGNYAKTFNSNFIIIPQNGSELVGNNADTSSPNLSYINAIDGIGQEDLFYGYNNDNEATPIAENEYTISFLDCAKRNGDVKILVTDYCSTHSKMDDSYSQNSAKEYISFSANHRALDNIPNYPTTIYNENSGVITNLQDAKNFLYLIQPDNEYSSKQEFVNAVKNTNYDFIIMDYFFDDSEFTTSEITELKQKANGGTRLLICYMSIGEAEDYRYYWKDSWSSNPPSWLGTENPDWEGNYKIKYWKSDWQEIIFGNDNSYLYKIINTGFDGVYLDIIDGYEFWED